MNTSFKPTSTSTIPLINEPLTESETYWKDCLEDAKVVKEYGAINSIDINTNDHDILITSSNRIALYEYYSLEVKRSYTAPNYSPLFGATYRKSDNKLIVAGSPDGIIRIWDINNNKPLRTLGDIKKHKNVKHTGPVRRCYFYDMSKVVSFSDDKHIKLWDIADESLISCLGHTDIGAHENYIRAGLVMPDLSMILSGSYDKSVKIWDVRDPTKPTHQIDHGSNVEAITVRNLLAISVGGDTVKIFDIVAGKVLKTMPKAHNNIITCAYNYQSNLLTGSIDGYVKVYDSNFKIVSSLSYVPGEVLSCAFDDKVLVVGAIDGLISVNGFKLKEKIRSKNKKKNKVLTRFNRAHVEIMNDDMMTMKSVPSTTTYVRDDKDGFKKRKLAKHDILLKEFNYSAALDRVLRESKPDMIVGLMQELIRRNGLKIALAGRHDKQLKPVIEFLNNYLQDPRYNRVLIDVALILTDQYINLVNRSPKTQEMFKKLNIIVNQEVNKMHQMLMISGQLNSILNNSIK